MKTVAVAACLFALAPLAHAALVDPSQSFEQVEVAPGIIAFIATESNSNLVTGNAVAIIGDDGVLVVDSGHFPALTRRQIAEIKKRTDKPVRFLVNTHWHSDHNSGNAEYRKAFPGIAILSTDYTRTQMAALVPKYAGSRAGFERYAENYRNTLRKGTNAEGQPLTPEQRLGSEQEVKNGEIALRERLWETPLVLPNVTFHDAISIHLGQREVRLMWLGRGNTGGDAVIFVPDSGVVMTGDLVVMPTPYAYGSFLSEWRETLHKIKDLGATVLVPGHGPVQHDWHYVERLDALLKAMLEQVAKGAAAGKTLAEIRKTLDFDAFRREFCGDDATRANAFEEGFMEPASARAFEEIKLENEE